MQATADASMGMRLGASSFSDDAGQLSLADVAERLAAMRSTDELGPALPLMERLMHADRIAISRVLAAERCVQTVADWTGTGAQLREHFSYSAYPTTEHVISRQVAGQVIAGDPAADPAELELLFELGLGTVLMAPIVFRGATVGLLEVYRAVARPWTGAEIDTARLLSHALGASVRPPDAAGAARELPWSPEAFGADAAQPAG